jgi:hypothetical protein
MKAKLFHAEENTEAALEILSKLPSWHAPFVKEQLFAKGTPEFNYWNKRNCYGLMDVMSIKLARMIRFDNSLSIEDKLERLEAMGEAFSEMSNRSGLEFFCIGEQAIYAIAVGMLTADNTNIENVIRIREKQFVSMGKMAELAKNDEIMKENIKRTYKTDDMIEWELNRLFNSPHPQFAKLRENPKYMEMLLKWKK